MGESNIQLFEYYLLPGYIFFNPDPSIISTVLGSNIAVSLWDLKKKYGGVSNYLYPTIDAREKATSLYGNVAVRYLVKMFLEEGSRRRDLRAQIFGGAENMSAECAEIAAGNVEMARRILKGFTIEIVSEDVGGNLGRKIVFNTLKNETIVYKVQMLRSSDWYPYSFREDRGL